MRPPHPALTALLALLSLAIVVQAALAGAFIGGAADTRFAHMVIGSLLPFFALVPAIVALAVGGRGQLRGSVRIGAAAFPVLLWVQEVLGHLPGASPTAVHVPLGVLLFGGSLALVAGSLVRAEGAPGGRE